MKSTCSIGIVGTGFIAKGILFALENQPHIRPRCVLTRRPPEACSDFPRPDLLTRSLEKLLRTSDLIVECTGHPLHAARVIDAALANGLPVVTSDVEFHVTLGSCFEGRGTVTEAEGDQPGVLAVLRAELLEMGFTPRAYGNLKRFYNPDPSREQMEHWAERLGIRLRQVTAFTDGTKVQLEMALVANAFGAGLVQPGMVGGSATDVEDFGRELGSKAEALQRPIVDYAVSPTFPAGVVITATANDPRQTPYLEYLKLGAGPSYTFLRPYHLCHLEMIKTIRRTLDGRPALLTNGHRPEISVAAVAKHALRPGDRIEQGIGSFQTRGICVNAADEPGHVPIGVLFDALVIAPVEAGEILRFDHVHLPDSFGLQLWKAHQMNADGRSENPAARAPEDAPYLYASSGSAFSRDSGSA